MRVLLSLLLMISPSDQREVAQEILDRAQVPDAEIVSTEKFWCDPEWSHEVRFSYRPGEHPKYGAVCFNNRKSYEILFED
jgi:hypothetical protein